MTSSLPASHSTANRRIRWVGGGSPAIYDATVAYHHDVLCHPAATAHCLAYGHDLPLWFDAEMTDEEDDAAYEAWLDTSCPVCEAIPRDFLTKKKPKTIH